MLSLKFSIVRLSTPISVLILQIMLLMKSDTKVILTFKSFTFL